MSKNKFGGIISLALMVGTTFLPISIIAKVLIILAIVGLDFYLNRALLYFVQANKNIMSKKDKDAKAWKYYEKSFNTGKLETKYLVTMANVVAQKGDPNFALKIINGALERENTEEDLVNQAKVQKSMILELTGKIDEGIALLQEIRKSGYRDKSLYINLACYLLYIDNKSDATEVLDEGKDYEETNAGALDNRGWLYILNNEWSKASQVYADMIERRPAFPDPYVHAAQVKLHYNKVEDAIELLNDALKKKFNKVSFFKKEIIEEMIENLKKENNELYVATFNASVTEIAKGLRAKNISDEEAKKLVVKTFEEEPVFEKIEKKVESKKTKKNKNSKSIDDSKDYVPNTELTEEDLEWEKNHRE